MTKAFQNIMSSKKEPQQIHLVILVHGLWGNVSHMEYLCKKLSNLNNSSSFSNEQLHVHISNSNEHYKTYDGIDVCGTRLAKEVESLIKELSGPISSESVQGQTTVVKFSMIGYSLGGLIARYAVGLLHNNKVFDLYQPQMELVNFTTFCTPHVGVFAPGFNKGVKIFNSLVPKCLGNSGKQMFLKDSDKLLYLMALPNSIFMNGLKRFAKLSLYSNCINDTRTSYWTSGISMNDPFFDLIDNENPSIVEKFQYVTDYAPVVLDNKKPFNIVSFANKIEDQQQNQSRRASLDTKKSSEINKKRVKKTKKHHRANPNFAQNVDVMTEFYFFDYWCSKLYKWFKVLLNFLILLVMTPFWILNSTTKGILENCKSYIRVSKHYRSATLLDYFENAHYSSSSSSSSSSLTQSVSSSFDSSSSLSLASSKSLHPSQQDLQDNSNQDKQIVEDSLEENFENGLDTFVNSVYQAIERVEIRNAGVGDSISELNNAKSLQVAITIDELENHSIEQLTKKYCKTCHASAESVEKLLENFQIHINNKEQLAIIENLNRSLKWNKFPILIRNTKATHAAAIVRHNDPFFNEGKVVVKHYINEVFKV